MYKEHPEVTTPGVWGIKEGAVVTMTLDRERGELTFEVADTPPFTLYNVSVRDSFPQNPRLANFGLDPRQSTVFQTKKLAVFVLTFCRVQIVNARKTLGHSSV